MPDPHTISMRAHAKVNLALAVGPPLPPTAGAHAGFHPICSWMHAIDLFDDLTITRLRDHEPSRHEITWAVDAPRPSPIDWPVEKDLCVRAHRAIERLVGRALPLHLSLRKRTPVGGGLGGGSSDAAVTIRALNTLFDLNLSPQPQLDIARTLGSDVAFFLGAPSPLAPPPPAIVSGLGERLEPQAPVPGCLLLILPPMGCPTGPVYRAFDAAPSAPLNEPRVRAIAARAAREARVPDADLFNDLAAAAFAVAPALEAIRHAAAHALGRPVHVTGSGSTLFAIFPTPRAAADARARVRTACPSVALLAAPLI